MLSLYILALGDAHKSEEERQVTLDQPHHQSTETLLSFLSCVQLNDVMLNASIYFPLDLGFLNYPRSKSWLLQFHPHLPPIFPTEPMNCTTGHCTGSQYMNIGFSPHPQRAHVTGCAFQTFQLTWCREG